MKTRFGTIRIEHEYILASTCYLRRRVNEVTLLEAFFLYLGMACLIAQVYFVVPFLVFFVALSFFRPDLELSPQDL